MPYPDPIYGSITIDTKLLWDQTFRPPLVMDPEGLVWREVTTGLFDDLLESQFMLRWRTRGIAGTEGIFLTAKGAELGWPRPDTWTDARYKPPLLAIDGGAFGRREPQATIDLAEALVDGPQTVEVSHTDPLIYCVVYYSTTADEAELYLNALEFVRPRGTTLCLIYSPVPKTGVFVLDTSALDGPHVLASLA